MFRQTRALLKRLTGGGDERRIHTRHRLDVETICRALADDADMPARIRNVSRSGINLEVPRTVPEGTMIRVGLPAVTDGPQTTILACVTNVRAASEGLWSLGCVFSLELSDPEMRLFGGEKTPSKTNDQRAWVRYPAQGTITYHLLSGNSRSLKTAEIVDLAPAGIGLIASEFIEAGSAMTINLRRHDGQPDRQILACVVYVANREDGKCAAGCNFLHELGEKDLNELVWRSSA